MPPGKKQYWGNNGEKKTLEENNKLPGPLIPNPMTHLFPLPKKTSAAATRSQSKKVAGIIASPGASTARVVSRQRAHL